MVREATMRDAANTISKPKLYAIMVLMVIFGTCDTLV